MRTLSRFVLAVLVFTLSFGSAAYAANRAAAPVTIHVLTMDQAAMPNDEMDKVAKEFMAANPNVQVEMEYVSYDALHDKFVTAMATNPPPYDVIMVDVIWYEEFVKSGYLADVTDKITPDMRNNVFKTAWNVVTVKDKVYGMPWLVDTKYLYYNQTMLKAAGFDNPPKTWEELITQAKAIKAKGLADYPIDWSWSQAEAAICDFTALVAGNGGQFLDASGKPAFNDAKGVGALQWMVQSLNDGLTNPSSITSVEEDVRGVFSSGKAAFALNWLYMYQKAQFDTKESQITGQVGITTVPVFDAVAKSGVKSASVDGSSGFSVVANSPNKDAAWSFIQYLTSEPTQIKYSDSQTPIWTTSYTGDKLKQLEGVQGGSVIIPIFNEQFQYATVRPRVPYYLEGSKALQLALQQALTKQKTPQQALDDAAATWTKLGSQ
ncbi:MAG TPA: extracellular solute-binding protein [Aggregatilineales bacterium]|nr:extracellular solute-binding protein [Aggregatilineales bacterium]